MKKIGKILYKVIACFAIFVMIWAIAQRASDNRFSMCGLKIFTVITGSMIPVYNIGDILIVTEITAEEIRVDDDIVYRGEKGSYKDKIVTHRVKKIQKMEDGNYSIITQGVANPGQDPEINQTQVVGKVIGKIPIINWILNILNNIYIIIVFIPAAILIYINVKKIKEYE